MLLLNFVIMLPTNDGIVLEYLETYLYAYDFMNEKCVKRLKVNINITNIINLLFVDEVFKTRS